MTGHRIDIGPVVPRPVRVALVVVGILAILAWVLLAAAHLNDRYNVNAVSGALLALADRARVGVLYPPLFDGQAYGGTRTMPVPILLYAASMAAAHGELLAPAKAIDFLASAALVGILVAVLRRQGAGASLSIGLASTVVTSQVFLLVATGVRPESLPTALQLGAVGLIAFRPRRSACALAAVLCAIALFSKLSALWAPAAIMLWLLGNDRRRLVLFAAVFAFGVAALMMAFTSLSAGRMLTNLTELGGAGVTPIGIVKAPLKAIELLLSNAQSTFMLLAALLLGLLATRPWRRPTIFQLGLIAAVGLLLIVMADLGSDYNHLLDVIVLVPIVTFELAQSAAKRVTEPRLLWLFMVSAIVIGSSAALAANAGSGIAATLHLPGGPQPSALDPQPLALELEQAGPVLSEDPYVPLSRGERPIVMDPFMLLRLADRDPGLVEPLLERVDKGLFQAVVLTENLVQPGSAERFETLSFGPDFYDAIRDNYRLCSVAGEYFLYVPNSQSCPPSAS